MRVLALDVGSKRIGVAISDPTGTIAGVLTVLQRRSIAADTAAIAHLVRSEGAEQVLMGLPLSLSGAVGPQARATLEFKAALQQALEVPILTWDERFSTKDAQEILRAQGVRGRQQRQRVDATAAALLLQAYLDSLKAGGGSGKGAG